MVDELRMVEQHVKEAHDWYAQKASRFCAGTTDRTSQSIHVKVITGYHQVRFFVCTSRFEKAVSVSLIYNGGFGRRASKLQACVF
jgi:hypothetical protein